MGSHAANGLQIAQLDSEQASTTANAVLPFLNEADRYAKHQTQTSQTNRQSENKNKCQVKKLKMTRRKTVKLSRDNGVLNYTTHCTGTCDTRYHHETRTKNSTTTGQNYDDNNTTGLRAQ